VRSSMQREASPIVSSIREGTRRVTRNLRVEGGEVEYLRMRRYESTVRVERPAAMSVVDLAT
jgi:hypothetical protein